MGASKPAQIASSSLVKPGSRIKPEKDASRNKERKIRLTHHRPRHLRRRSGAAVRRTSEPAGTDPRTVAKKGVANERMNEGDVSSSRRPSPFLSSPPLMPSLLDSETHLSLSVNDVDVGRSGLVDFGVRDDEEHLWKSEREAEGVSSG